MSEFTAHQPFSKEALLTLAGGDETFAAELIDAFFLEAPARIDAIKQAYANKDAGELRLHAHALKGAAESVAASTIHAMALAIEMAAAADNLEQAVTNIEKMEHELTALMQTLAGLTRK
jgi:HPt (histidine-containing phosphotransfer) domain-containing protein